jgi:hypothetical protein
MIKTVEVIVIIALIIFSFFLGVKYSESVKSHMSWLETQDEQEVELPDLSNENGEAGVINEEVVDPNAPILDNVDPTASSNQGAQPSAPIENAQVPAEQNQVAPAPAPVQAPAPVVPAKAR